MIRFLDLTFSIISIIFLSPLLVLVSILLLFTGEHKIIYKQIRVGKDGKHFMLLKFATMLEDSPNLEGGDITSGNDPRVLPVGKFLRKTKINEIPQIFNIYLGDMSFVGPRPLTPNNFSFYACESQKIIKTIKPGLTGIGSIIFRDEESIIQNSQKKSLDCYKEDITPYKSELELWFSNNNSVTVYFTLILLTSLVIVFPNSKVVWRFFPKLPPPPSVLRPHINFVVY